MYPNDSNSTRYVVLLIIKEKNHFQMQTLFMMQNSPFMCYYVYICYFLITFYCFCYSCIVIFFIYLNCRN